MIKFIIEKNNAIHTRQVIIFKRKGLKYYLYILLLKIKKVQYGIVKR